MEAMPIAGIKDKWKIRVQLTKPVTWPPLIWGVVCGAAASGNFHWTPEDVAKSIVCMLMSGPFLTGYTQTINDWYDREIDAINEPYRPIPSGAISAQEVITQIWVLLLGGLGLAGFLDVWAGHDFPVVFYLALGGSLLSYIYSAPPLKLKQNGWIGNFALGASYISLPWTPKMLEAQRRSTIIILYKNKGTFIVLLSHTLKVWERVVELRLRRIMTIFENQFGFMPGCLITEAIHLERKLVEQCRERKKEIQMVFIDLVKAYNKVPKEVQWRYLKARHVPVEYTRLIHDMYDGAKTHVRAVEGDSEHFLWAGQALFGTLTPDIIVLTLLYSIAGLGIAIVNDFKSIEGDRAMGLQSLPVAFGSEAAKWICVGAIDITQISVAGYLLGAGKPYYAFALLGLIAPQVFFQFKYFLKDPVKYDVKYQASAQPFLILGLLVTALATSSH
ncbi:Chlorophyll synthase, chloroplastic [Capsicum annuum]|nr:Chlorophyll synthase, chloroplastic [Capsicum annuum]